MSLVSVSCVRMISCSLLCCWLVLEGGDDQHLSQCFGGFNVDDSMSLLSVRFQFGKRVTFQRANVLSAN